LVQGLKISSEKGAVAFMGKKMACDLRRTGRKNLNRDPKEGKQPYQTGKDYLVDNRKVDKGKNMPVRTMRSSSEARSLSDRRTPKDKRERYVQLEDEKNNTD